MARKVAIVGVGQTYHKARRPDVSQVEMVNEAVRAALNDAEITQKDIDMVVQGDMELFQGGYQGDMWHTESTGAYMKPGIRLATGGTTGTTLAIAAFEYVAAGLADVVLAVGWQKHDEGDPNAGLATVNYQLPLMNRKMAAGAMRLFAVLGEWYMNKYGAGPEHAAMVRLKADKNACRNPYTHLRLGLKSVDDVFKSPLLVWPLRLLDMCPASTGACALIVASEEAAKKISPKPVWVQDWVTSHQESIPPSNLAFVEQESSLTDAAKKLYKRNHITDPLKQLDVFEMYEPSSWAELIWMGDFLLCDRSESFKLVEKGVTELEGELPINPSGGVVSCNPIGATAMIRVAEAALQVRGDAGDHQVPKDVNTAVATGFGGTYWSNMILLKKTLD